MALLSKVTKTIALVFFTLLVIAIGVYFMLFKKANDKYIIKKIAFIFFALLVIATIGAYFMLFKKVNDKYVIDAVHLRKIQLVRDSLNGYSVKEYSKSTESLFIGIGVRIDKKYIPSENSKRILFAGSREPGTNCSRDTIETFDIILEHDGKKKNISSLMFCKDLKHQIPHKSEENNGLIKNDESTSFTSFISDINECKKYTNGTRLDNLENFFWINKNAIENIDLSSVKFYYRLKTGEINENGVIE